MTPRVITRLSIMVGLILLAVALTLSRAIPDSTDPAPVPLPPVPLSVTPQPPEVLPGPPAPTAVDRYWADMEALKDPILWSQPVVTPAPAPAPAPQPQPTYVPQQENRRRGIFRR